MKTDGFYFHHTERNLEIGGLALVQQLDTMKAGISVIFLVFSSWCEMAAAALAIVFKTVRNEGWEPLQS